MSTNNKMLPFYLQDKDLSKMRKIVFWIFLVCCFSITYYSCTKIEENDVDISSKLVPYFEKFAAEGAKRGITIDYNQGGMIGKLDIISNGGVVGQCYKTANSPNRIVIDVQYWNKIDTFQREFLIFHELGHCKLDRDHLDTKKSNGNCVSIMHSTEDICKFDYNNDTREAYIDELFNK